MPDNRTYPITIQSIGDHIKTVRLKRNILIKDVISLLDIDRETLRFWESGICQPTVKHYPKIISFLGYNPLEFNTNTFADKVKKYRYVHGLTQENFAQLIDVFPCVVSHWETKNVQPNKSNQKRILELFNQSY